MKLGTTGVAAQSLLSGYLQPSVFGVLLLASLALFLQKRVYLAILLAVISATFHTSLMLHVGILIGAYILALVMEKEFGTAVKIGLLTLVLLSPIAFYILKNFIFSDSPEVHSTAHIINVTIRQPHHTLIAMWFSIKSCLKLAIVVLGIVLSRRCRPLFFVLLVCTLTVVLLTLLQWITGSLSLAILFPWRSSAWLVPLSTGLVLFHFVVWFENTLNRLQSHSLHRIVSYNLTLLSCGGLILLGTLGIAQTFSTTRKEYNRGTVEEYVREHAKPNHVYLIPIEREQFRLATGVPVFVDWKVFPFRSSETLAWYDRIQKVNALYGAKTQAEAIEALRAIHKIAPITHIVVPTDRTDLITALHAKPLFQDRQYIVAQLESGVPTSITPASLVQDSRQRSRLAPAPSPVHQ